MKRSLLALWLTVSALTLPHPVQAAVEAYEHVDPLDIPPEQLFNATVISASKMPERLWDAPAAIYVLNNEDIKRSGATTIPEALRQVPGVEVARTGTSGWAVGIRGFNSALNNKLLVLIDGREIYDHLFSGVYWDIHNTPLEDIDRIEVVRGPGSTLWGANAVNGVINIITKSAEETQGTLVSETIGNQERNLTTVRHGGESGTHGHYRVYGKYTERDDSETLNGNNAHDEWKSYNTGFRYDQKQTDGDKLTFQGDAYKGESGQFRSTPLLISPYSMLQQESISSHGANLLTNWSRTFDDASELKVQAYIDYTYRHQLLIGDTRASADFETQYELPQKGAHKVIFGGRYRYSYNELTPSDAITFRESRYYDHLFSGFVQDKITLKPRELFLTVGTKVEHHEYTDFEIQPNARLQWHPDDGKMVWTSVARSVRTPSRLEHDLTITTGVIPPIFPAPFNNTPIAVDIQPSPGFQSEKMIAYELGYRQQLTPKASLDISTFYNDYSDLGTLSLGTTTFNAAPAPFGHFILPIFVTNLTKAETYGIETVLNWQARPDLELSAVHSFLKMELHGPPSSQAIASEAAEQQSPQSQLALKANWDATEKLNVDALAYHVSRLSNYRVGGYWRFDMRLAYKFTDKVEASLAGQNLFSGDHREFSMPTDVNATKISPSVYGNILWRF